MKKVIGLTGAIATGKSTVAKLFIDEGIYVIDSDVLAKEALDNPKVIDQIVEAFGEVVLLPTGAINRVYLGEVIFADIEKRLELNAIVHPIVKKQIQELLTSRRNELVVVDVPLMYETDIHEMMDEIVVVYAPLEVQAHRLMERSHFDYEDAMLRIGAQISIEEKKEMADYVLDNSGAKMQLYRNFRELLKKL
ncbi:dephospho-CoA kinase [Erysipelotrichaceae bacterium]|nr:dephospho-CoA kinase [Erysipelotrichaceae bacterium]